MASIFERVRQLVEAGVHGFLDKVEDPEQMLRQSIREMKEGLAEGKEELARALASLAVLEGQIADQRKTAAAWESKAELAVESGRDDLALQCLEKKSAAEQAADEAQTQLDLLRPKVDAARSDLDALKRNIESAEAEMATLIARQNAAEATRGINETISGIGEKGSGRETFDRMKAKVVQTEAEATAAKVVNTTSLDEQLSQLGSSSKAKSDLEALKAKMAARKAGDQ